ncbi:MAG: hypothetical protein LLG24_07840, partial [Actinomycetia bacterium]|nr:hypothetical protein [Actinomycetes bacterium]
MAAAVLTALIPSAACAWGVPAAVRPALSRPSAAQVLPAPYAVTVTAGDMADTVTWKVSGRSALPVYVFRAPRPEGPFTLLT